jgi:lipopolysaccharide export system protein LptC
MARKIGQHRVRRIVALRRALPAFAAVVVLAVVGQAGWRTYVTRQVAPASGQALLRMDNPRFTGTTKDGRAFLITADAAVRDAVKQDHVTLDKPVIVRGVGTPDSMRTTADRGIYQENDGVLVLTGDVKVDNGEGYRFATQQAKIDTKTGAVVGDTALAAQGPNAQIRSDRYAVED